MAFTGAQVAVIRLRLREPELRRPFHIPGKPPAGVAYEYNQGFQGLVESWNYFGFVVMDFEGETIKVRYINERGVEHHSEEIHKK